jgi:hypothetical protein
VSYFDTKKLRKLWQYQVLTALKKAVRGTPHAKAWSAKLGRMFAQATKPPHRTRIIIGNVGRVPLRGVSLMQHAGSRSLVRFN